MAVNVTLNTEKRRIYMTGPIDADMTHQMMLAIHKLEETVGDITIIMNSEGGVETAGYAIYDALMSCKNMVIVEGYGEIYSIAAAIFQAADIRRMSPNSMFMIHNGTIPVGDEAKQTVIMEMANQIKKENKRYYAILSGRSKLSFAEIEEACDQDTYYTPEEALSAGFCDEILVPTKIPAKPKKTRKKKV